MDNAACIRPPGKIIPVVAVSRCEAKGACVMGCAYDVLEIGSIEPSDVATIRRRAQLAITFVRVNS